MLELDDLTRHYGDVRALDGLTFTVEPGQVFGFVGANGAGKTTAMRIVMGVDRSDSGAVRWQGQPVDADARRQFGYMPEERGLYPKMPCRRQLTYLARLHGLSKADARDRATRWLAHLGLADRADDKLEELSLGNQQRVQVAAALVHDPTLLVLDEPFSGLDPLGVDVMSEILLERAQQGVPAIFSSHQLELVERLCDAVAIIDRGRLVASGTVADLRRREQPMLRVDVEAPDPHGWVEGLPGVVTAEPNGQGVLIELASDADPDVLLDAARAAGRVRHFGFVEPKLAQRYREVVVGPGEAVA